MTLGSGAGAAFVYIIFSGFWLSACAGMYILLLPVVAVVTGSLFFAIATWAL